MHMPDFSRSARSVKRLNVSLIRSAAAWSLRPATTRPTTTRACETTKSPAMSRTSRCNRPIVTCRNGRMNHLIEIRNQTAKITFCRENKQQFYRSLLWSFFVGVPSWETTTTSTVWRNFATVDPREILRGKHRPQISGQSTYDRKLRL